MQSVPTGEEMASGPAEEGRAAGGGEIAGSLSTTPTNRFSPA